MTSAERAGLSWTTSSVLFQTRWKMSPREGPFQACHRHLARVRMSSSPAPAPAGALQRSPSLRSTAEEDGLRRALEIVRAQGEHFKSDGMSPANFFVGLMNVGVSAFMLGRCPEYYWVYASVRISRRLSPLPSRDPPPRTIDRAFRANPRDAYAD